MNRIGDLEGDIANLKAEYAALIKETEGIKAEMEKVAVKVNRSKTLLSQLQGEEERWKASTSEFAQDTKTLLGDSVICAAFLSYAGICSWGERGELVSTWKGILEDSEITFQDHLSIAQYLNKQSEIKDQLCMENDAILDNFNRFPLIVDPTGEHVATLCSSKDIKRTSFLDQSFLKQLESAMRFGTKLLVQDVEYFDPIMNSVLNKEIQRSGGRTLVRLGKQDIDLSPAFVLYLSTDNPDAHFPPDLASRVTLVSFTETSSSLYNRSLVSLMSAREPELEQKRKDTLKLQGEYKVSLNLLEQKLLFELTSSKGKILEQDSLLLCLEKLKEEANAISDKFAANQEAQKSVEVATAKYKDVASVFVKVYFAINSLSSINHLYRWSLEQFMEMINEVVEKESSNDKIINCFLKTVYTRVSKGLFACDKVLFLLILLFSVDEKSVERVLKCAPGEVVAQVRGLAKSMLGEAMEDIGHTKETPLLIVKCEGVHFDPPEEYENFALGNEEQSQLERILNGDHLCLQNIHLVPDWIEKNWKTLEQKDIILVSEISERMLPAKMMSTCSKLVLEPKYSVKELLLRKLGESRDKMGSTAYHRLLAFKTIYTWAVLRVRDKYMSKPSVVQDLDLQLALSTVEEVLQVTSDLDVIVGFISQLFVNRVTEDEECRAVESLVSAKMNSLRELEGFSYEELVDWTKELKDATSLEDLGLCATAEQELIEQHGKDIRDKFIAFREKVQGFSAIQ